MTRPGIFALGIGWIVSWAAAEPALKFERVMISDATFEAASAFDVDRDGKIDIVSGGFWYAGPDFKTRHKMCDMRREGEYHDLMLVDVDNDGKVELVTGKRYRAHNGRDPGADDPIGVYYFEMDRGKFTRVTLDYGPASRASGVGLYFWVEDVDGNGWKDIVAPGKEGLYLFKNLGPAGKPGAAPAAAK